MAMLSVSSQTLSREWAYVRLYGDSQERLEALPEWLRYYNSSRPHGSLGRSRPELDSPS
jgi:transposase InsO family protein